MSEIFVLGLTAHGPTARQIELLKKSSLIIAGKRLAAVIPEISAPVLPVTPLDSAIKAIEDGLAKGNVSVLASGDPLFFGIAKRLIHHFGQEQVLVFPALSSMQEAFSRFKIPWDDAALVSLHGREKHHIAGQLLSCAKTFVFTDKKNSPNRIAKEILNYLQLIGNSRFLSECRLWVAENIGSKKEKVTTGSLVETADRTYSDLNVLCIERPDLPERPAFGLNENEIVHSRGLITKDEVRAAALHRLRLPRKGVFWDVGGGSGSISIEAASMNPQLTVYTVERKSEELENIKENICRFGCFNVIPVAGMAADVLSNLPDPDSVFVGGNGGELKSIVKEAAARLPQHGRLVVNGVIEKTISEAPKLMQKAGLSVEMSTIEIKRKGPDGLDSFNPITIMVGQK
jgi:precorrin-6Y C5,15-methyltransferase (decarboxylating)